MEPAAAGSNPVAHPMKVIVQRVNSAYVAYGNKKESIKRGLLIFLGIKNSDTEKNLKTLTKKILNLRIFPSKNKNIDKSILEIKGEILVIPNFTLYGDVKRGNRPSFGEAMPSEKAKILFEKFVEELKSFQIPIKKGKFGANMEVFSVSDGPVNIIIES